MGERSGEETSQMKTKGEMVGGRRKGAGETRKAKEMGSAQRLALPAQTVVCVARVRGFCATARQLSQAAGSGSCA